MPPTDRRTRRRRRVRRRRALAAGLVCALLGVTLLVLPRSGHAPGGHGTTTTAGRHRAAAAHATFAGPNGRGASWVVAENDRRGTAGWQITAPGGAGGIDGYASAAQVAADRDVTLFVSTAAPTYRVLAYRMGYYRGAGARLVWRSPVEPGAVQPPCPLTPGTNMVECAWAPSLHVRVTAAFVQGDYLLKLVGSTGPQSYVPLTVWDPSSDATYLVQNSVFTWQAWNTYGGYDFYGGGLPGATPTFDARSRVVSFDRPYAASFGEGAADFLGEEYPLVRFVEQHGLDVTYGTDLTTHEHPGLLLRHRVLLSLGHDEQWSLQMRNAAIGALDHGVNLVFFGASPVLRKVRLQPSPLGPDREVVNYRDPAEDPIVTTDPADVSENQWTQPPADWPPSELVGSTYLGYGINVPLVVTDPAAWLYRRTGLAPDARLPGVIASDFNGYVPGAADPANVEILAHSPATPSTGTAGFADTTYYTVPSGGGVFSTGTNGWIPAMSPCTPATSCAADALDLMTGDLLALFGTGPAGRVQPSVANWQAYYP